MRRRLGAVLAVCAVVAFAGACSPPPGGTRGTSTSTTTTTVLSGTPVVVDDNFRFSGGCGVVVSASMVAPDQPNPIVPAQRFVVSGSAVALTRAILELWQSSSSPEPMTVRVMVVPTHLNPAQPATSGDEPDLTTVLASADVDWTPAACGITSTVAFNSPPLLQPGAYWIVAQPLTGIGSWVRTGIGAGSCSTYTRGYGHPALVPGGQTWGTFDDPVCGLLWRLEGVAPE
jgi:hypothetical protein